MMDGFDNDSYAAGYEQGYDEGRILGYKEGKEYGYREGYNAHARSRAYAEQVYGPYGTGGARDVYTQHGAGENP